MNRIQFALCVAFACLYVTSTSAQQWQWGNGYGGSSVDYGFAVATDPANNIIGVGSFSSTTLTFGSLSPLVRSGIKNGYVAKFSSSGVPLWSKTFNLSASEESSIFDVVTDDNGNIFVAGTFSGTMNMGGVSLTSNGLFDAFAAKLAPDGTVLWADKFGGSDNDYCQSIAHLSDGSLAISGVFISTDISFGTSTLSNGSSLDGYVAYFDNGGAPQWALHFQAEAIGSVEKVKVCSDNLSRVFCSVEYFSSVFQVPGTIINGIGNIDVAVLAYDLSENLLWHHTFGTSGADYTQDIVFNKVSDKVTLVGNFANENLDIHGNAVLPFFGNFDIFSITYSANGVFVFADSYGGSDSDLPAAISCDVMGNQYLIGNYSSSDFNLAGQTLPNASSFDAFVVKYNEAGFVQRFHTMTGTLTENISGVATDGDGAIYVVGSYNSADMTADAISFPPANGNDIFLASVSPCYSSLQGTITLDDNSLNLTVGDTISVTLLKKGFETNAIWKVKEQLFLTEDSDDDNFNFTNIGLGYFVVRVEDKRPTAVNCITTFSGNTHVWEDAEQLVSNECDFLQSDIEILNPPLSNGSNSTNGYLYFSDFYFGKTHTNNDPIPLIDVVVEKDSLPNQYLPYTQVKPIDTQIFPNYFSFERSDLPNGNYRLRVSIPGIPQIEPVTFTLSGTQTIDSINFCVDTVEAGIITVCNFDTIPGSPQTGIETNEAPIVQVFPNPFYNQLHVQHADPLAAYQLINPIGQTLKEGILRDGSIHLNELQPGIYVLKITGESSETCFRIQKLSTSN